MTNSLISQVSDNTKMKMYYLLVFISQPYSSSSSTVCVDIIGFDFIKTGFLDLLM